MRAIIFSRGANRYQFPQGSKKSAEKARGKLSCVSVTHMMDMDSNFADTYRACMIDGASSKFSPTHAPVRAAFYTSFRPRSTGVFALTLFICLNVLGRICKFMVNQVACEKKKEKRRHVGSQDIFEKLICIQS